MNEPGAPVSHADDAGSVGPRPRPRLISNAIGVALIAAGLALVGSAVRYAFHLDDVNQSPPLALLVDPAEMTQQEQALAGTLATGDEEGDRAIVIDVGGKIRLQELGPHGAVRLETALTFRLGRRDRKLYLAVANGGQIEVTNRDTLVYYRDIYRRVR
jgi:hypothetical protein